MKLLIFLAIMAALISPTSMAQNAPTGKAILQVQPGKKGAAALAGAESKTPGKPQEPHVFYGGLFADLARGNKPAKPVDVRQPAKPKPVADNVYADPQTGTIKGFVLFAIKF